MLLRLTLLLLLLLLTLTLLALIGPSRGGKEKKKLGESEGGGGKGVQRRRAGVSKNAAPPEGHGLPPGTPIPPRARGGGVPHLLDLRRARPEEEKTHGRTTHSATATASTTTTTTTTLSTLTALTLGPTRTAAAAAAAPEAPRPVPETGPRLAERLHVLLALLGAVEPTRSGVPTLRLSVLPQLLLLLVMVLLIPTGLVRSFGARLDVGRDRVEEGRLGVVVLFGSRRRHDKVVVRSASVRATGGDRCSVVRRSRLDSRALERGVRLFKVKVGLRHAGARGGRSGLTERLQVAALASSPPTGMLLLELLLVVVVSTTTASRSRKDRRADSVLGATSSLLLRLTQVGARHVLGELLDIGRLLLWR